MKSIITCRNCKAILCLLFPVIFSTSISYAQQVTTISNYVIFAGTSTALPTQTTPPAPGYGVQLGSSSNVQGGSIGSNKLIKTTGAAVMNSNIYSNGTIVLANSNTVTGKITAANSGTVSGTILSVG
ncbi:MAG: hypothetical protein WCG67_10395, partial [Ferruginibacter sp.]